MRLPGSRCISLSFPEDRQDRVPEDCLPTLPSGMNAYAHSTDCQCFEILFNVFPLPHVFIVITAIKAYPIIRCMMCHSGTHNVLSCPVCMSCGAVCAHIYMCGAPLGSMPSARCAFRPPDLFARVWRSCPVPSTYNIVSPSLSCQSQYLCFT